MAKQPRPLNPEHPENDLSEEADYSNRPHPMAADVESLADFPDPAELHRKNQHSSKQAILYGLAVPLVTFISAYILAWVARLQGGPLCDAGTATWICSRSAELWWPISTSIIAFGGMLGGAWILYDKYRNYLRWRAWMGVLWILIPFSMLWATSVLPLSILGH